MKWNTYPRPQLKRDNYVILNGQWSLDKKQIEVPSISAGDIGCTTKLAYADTSDTLCDAKNAVILENRRYNNR